MEESLNPMNIEGSLISLMSNKVKTHGGINLAQGIPAFAPPQSLLKQLQDTIAGPFHQYPPSEGHPGLRKYLEEKYIKRGLTTHQFIITQGATEALSLCYNYLWSFSKGSLPSLTIDPAYESFIHLPRIFRQNLVLHVSDPAGLIDFDLLQNQIINNKIRLIFIASPGNPLGRTLQKKEWSNLFHLSAQYGFFVIADLVYDQLYYDHPQDIPFEEAHDRIFFVESFSKLFSITGWRIGALGFHSKHFYGIKNTHDYTGLCAPSILQEALYNFLCKQTETANKYLEQVRRQLSNNKQLASNILEENGFKVMPAQGGYFIWVRLPCGIDDALQFALNLYENTQTAVVPGVHFSKHAKNFIRINLARTQEEIQEGLRRLCDFIGNYNNHGKD